MKIPKFKKASEKYWRHRSIVGRGFITLPILWKIPYIAYLSNFIQPPLPLFLLPCFFDWMSDRGTSDVLFYTMDLHMSSLGTLVPQGPCGVFYATRHQFTEV